MKGVELYGRVRYAVQIEAIARRHDNLGLTLGQSPRW